MIGIASTPVLAQCPAAVRQDQDQVEVGEELLDHGLGNVLVQRGGHLGLASTMGTDVLERTQHRG